MDRFLLDGLGTPFFVEVDDAETFRIVDVVAKEVTPSVREAASFKYFVRPAP